ncbi:MAG: hypothetical protein AB1424_15045 [Thermodesulfobacteriota bacterium]
MSFDVQRLPPFDGNLEKVLKKYPLSSTRINGLINSIGNSYQDGDVYPGFGECQVRKIRLGLEEYNLKPRKGLRLIFLVIPKKNKIVPLIVYKKGEFKSEDEIKHKVKKHLKDLLATLTSK